MTGFDDGKTTASYAYNANGLRMEKIVNGQRINHVWDGSQQIVADIVDNQFYEAECYIRGTSLAATYNYCNGEKSDYTYYIQNAHGDIVNLTDANGAVIKSYTYDAFGVEKNIDDADTNAFRYCGEYYDAETGTIYLRARYYQASIGRFTQRDSYAGQNTDPMSLNLYTYCGNNPLPYFDPSGHKFSFKKFAEGWNNSWQWVGESTYDISTGFKNEAKAKTKKVADESVSNWVIGMKDIASNHLIGISVIENTFKDNKGTLSLCSGGSASVGPMTYSLSSGFCFDWAGNVGFQRNVSVGVIPSAGETPEEVLRTLEKNRLNVSASVAATVMSCDTINDIEGVGLDIGASGWYTASSGIGIDSALNLAMEEETGRITNYGGTFGASVSLNPSDPAVYGQLTYTQVYYLGNIYRGMEKIDNAILAW